MIILFGWYLGKNLQEIAHSRCLKVRLGKYGHTSTPRNGRPPADNDQLALLGALIGYHVGLHCRTRYTDKISKQLAGRPAFPVQFEGRPAAGGRTAPSDGWAGGKKEGRAANVRP